MSRPIVASLACLALAVLLPTPASASCAGFPPIEEHLAFAEVVFTGRVVGLRNNDRTATFALTSGVRTHCDVLKGMMAGANVTMMASELLRNGVGRIRSILYDVEAWMVQHEYESVAQMRGSMSQQHVAEPAAFERANYMKVLQSWRNGTNGGANGHG